MDDTKITALLPEEALIRETAVGVLLNMLRIADEPAYWHSRSVARITRELMDEFGVGKPCPWTTEEKTQILPGALLHDIGMALLPLHLQATSRSLDDNQRGIVETHPRLGYELVRGYFGKTVSDIVLLHHVGADGTGYPDVKSLGVTDIPDYVSLVGYADRLDALLTTKPYRPAHSMTEAWDILAGEIDRGRLTYKFKDLLYHYIETKKII